MGSNFPNHDYIFTSYCGDTNTEQITNKLLVYITDFEYGACPSHYARLDILMLHRSHYTYSILDSQDD